MDWSHIVSIIIAIIAVLSGVQWALLWSKVKAVKNTVEDLVNDYDQAVIDGDITDEEKAKLLDTAIIVLRAASDVLFAITNIVMKIQKIISGNRTMRLAAANRKDINNDKSSGVVCEDTHIDRIGEP
jgi:hypothetical protein